MSARRVVRHAAQLITFLRRFFRTLRAILSGTRLRTKALRFAMSLSPEVIGLHVNHSEEESDLPQRWKEFIALSATDAGSARPRARDRNFKEHRTASSQQFAYCRQAANDLVQRDIFVSSSDEPDLKKNAALREKNSNHFLSIFFLTQPRSVFHNYPASIIQALERP